MADESIYVRDKNSKDKLTIYFRCRERKNCSGRLRITLEKSDGGFIIKNEKVTKECNLPIEDHIWNKKSSIVLFILVFVAFLQLHLAKNAARFLQPNILFLILNNSGQGKIKKQKKK